ncbi:unnamed protein product [Vitrella brassicaformis CCMP3155]|uniref:Transmembrane protein n=2 Tax=Vitrella brassicaformis TaxID=1169539 RepID=A0A0G4FD13_VITBC|nr:unnamed protein product [Vitrella brassicaformis CCMP3155]|eukprot:CEM10804.1 unnamed protein product [Vitrella brassicaformis CCMP3155]
MMPPSILILIHGILCNGMAAASSVLSAQEDSSLDATRRSHRHSSPQARLARRRRWLGLNNESSSFEEGGSSSSSSSAATASYDPIADDPQQHHHHHHGAFYPINTRLALGSVARSKALHHLDRQGRAGGLVDEAAVRAVMADQRGTHLLHNHGAGGSAARPLPAVDTQSEALSAMGLTDNGAVADTPPPSFVDETATSTSTPRIVPDAARDFQPLDTSLGYLLSAPLIPQQRPASAMNTSRVEWRPCPETNNIPTTLIVRAQSECSGSGPHRGGLWTDIDNIPVFEFSGETLVFDFRDNQATLPLFYGDVWVHVVNDTSTVVGSLNTNLSPMSLVKPSVTTARFADCTGKALYKLTEEADVSTVAQDTTFLTYTLADDKGVLGQVKSKLGDTKLYVIDHDGNRVATITRSGSWAAKDRTFCGQHAFWSVQYSNAPDGPFLAQAEQRWVVASLITVKSIWDESRDPSTGVVHSFAWPNFLMYLVVVVVVPLGTILAVVLFLYCCQNNVLRLIQNIEKAVMPERRFKSLRYQDPIT